MLTCQDLVLGQRKWVFSPVFFLLCRKMPQLVPWLWRRVGCGGVAEAAGEGSGVLGPAQATAALALQVPGVSWLGPREPTSQPGPGQ